jgi:hypothetical protein
MNRLQLHPRVPATICAAVLAILGVLHLRDGASWAPVPIYEILTWLFGYGPDLSSKLLAASEFAAAVALLVFGNRVLTVACAGALAFVSLACVSRALSAGGLLPPLATLMLGIGIVVLGTKARAPIAGPRRGLSPAWTALATITLATATGHVVAQSLANPADNASHNHDSDSGSTRIVSIDLDMHPFEGRRIEDTPVGSALPALRGIIGDETAFVVLYLPDCSACHSLFEQFFSLPRPELVVAVEVPAGDGIEQVDTGEEHGDIACTGCERLSLPVGPNWIVAAPMVLKIERGIVTCVADRFGGECLAAQ